MTRSLQEIGGSQLNRGKTRAVGLALFNWSLRKDCAQAARNDDGRRGMRGILPTPSLAEIPVMHKLNILCINEQMEQKNKFLGNRSREFQTR
jgi:hypothetical protein